MKHPFPFRWHSQKRFIRASSHFANMHESASREQLARSLGTLFAIYLCTLYSQRLGAFASSPHPDVRGFPTLRLLCPIRLLSRASGFRMGLPTPTVHSPYHPLRSLPCSLVGLKQDAVGGVWSMASSALCGSPVVPPGRTGVPVSPSTKRDGDFVLAFLPAGMCGRSLTGRHHKQGMSGCLFPVRLGTLRVDSPWHLSAKHCFLETCFLLTAPFRSMLLTLSSGRQRLTPRAHGVPVYPRVLPHSSCALSRRTLSIINVSSTR